MKKFLILFSLLIVGFTNVYGTHNRAGEITYEYVGDATHPYRYKIRVTTYTNTCNTSADRCELMINFGDNDSANAPRVNGISSLCPSTADGVMLLHPTCTKLNIYEITHDFPGPSPGQGWEITMDDQNRNAGVNNINNSVNTSFSLITHLIINPFLGPNTSPVLLNMPLDDACVGVCFYHNPGAYDPDGDSLSYSLTTCYANGSPIPSWQFPPNMSYSSIDALRGDLVWCSPTSIAEYNIAILIKEYRRLPSSPVRYFVGSVLRDMQIEVLSCVNNPPQIAHIDDTCIVAGTNLNFNVSATDVQSGLITLEASGGPFQITPTASFNSTPSVSPVTGTFSWTPSCSEVLLLPYLVTFKATDSDPGTALVDYRSVFIRVIAPAPVIVSATPSGASIIVDWNDAFCHSLIGDNPLSGYKVYRKNSCDPFVHDPCETGVPASSGYTLIGTTTTTTIFTDNNNGNGLVAGIDYSYIVVAYYSDGSQSYASGNVCAMLTRDVPVITNVSVLTTDPTNGSIWTHWIKPLSTVPNLDTIANPPPYQYRLMRAGGATGSLAYYQISSSTQYIYNSYHELPDTGFVSTGIDTRDTSYTYRVDLYYTFNGVLTLKGSTNSASSVFLSSTPAGGQVNLTWQTYVPWANYRYDVYKETPQNSGIFIFLDSTHTTSYSDTGLVNGQNYCYKVKTIGEYTDTLIQKPLVNTSQIRCESPVDLIPPCQPDFMVEDDCGIYQNVISWTNPNTYCSDDAVQINVYFAYTSYAPLQLIYSTTDMSITSFTHIYTYDGIPSIAGCYAVTAVDSAATPNESPIVNKTCVDNCPEYELPNVFTPNGDNVNDLVTPLPGYRYVKDVDMKIYDRWGLIMFQTEDKDILWDGKNKDTKGLCPDGVYFYICTVNEIHVDGIRPRVLKGFIQLFHESTTAPK